MAKQVRTVYGNALFYAARDAGRLTSVREQAEVILKALGENPDFARILCHPEILTDEKERIVEEIFGEKVDPLIMGIISVLLDKGHGHEIENVLESFTAQALEEEKIGVAQVTSAVPLNEEQKERIRQKLLDTTEYTSMRISYSTDPRLIGGLVIRLRDRVVDSSLRNKLDQMKHSLLAGV